MKIYFWFFKDLIFYWDMDVFNIFNELWDVLSVFCIVFVFYEISIMDVFDVNSYKNYVDSIMVFLVLLNYLVFFGKNGNFLLMYLVGSIFYGIEIDVFLNYVDYYFLEVLKWKCDIEEGIY